jgi:two-component system sensor histidine kinase KdpD
MVEISFAQSPSTGQPTVGVIDRVLQRGCCRTPEINRGPRSSMSGTGPLVTALLTSISHDLRTPLASILGCASSLSSCGNLLDDTTKQELIRTIQDEAELLNRFIVNLLNMTRLQAGELQLRTSPLELSDAIGSALRRAGKILAAHRTEVRLQPDLTLLDLDAVLFEQVLFNLLDNAAKYTPPGSLVVITAWRDGDVVRLQVLDEGPGIPPGDLDRVFEKFFRGDGTIRRCTGTGLGLAICLGFIGAMRGTITVANRSDRQGAVFTITLPVPTPIDLVEVVAMAPPKMGYRGVGALDRGETS